MPSRSVFINAGPEEVFTYIADLPRHKEWAADTVNPVPLSGGPVVVGKRYRSQNHFALGDTTDDIEITLYDPPRRFGFSAHSAEADVEHEFILSPQDGGTLMERVITMKRTTLPFKIIFPLAYLLVGRPSDIKSMNQLKARLEQQAP